MTAIKRILCPTDFSECSRHALDHAAALAQWYGARITVLHVNELIPHSPTPWGPSSTMFPSPTEIASALARFVEPLSHGVVPVETLSAEGDPVRIIVAKATELSCDLIVLGTHGRGGFSILVLGSVTEKVLRKAACPVLIVPPAGSRLARFSSNEFSVLSTSDPLQGWLFGRPLRWLGRPGRI